MANAMDFGFLPQNDADTNAAALQRAVNEGGTIYIDKPGIYDISETILLKDDTSLVFGAGVYLRRQLSGDGTQHASYVFINEGAFTRTYNNNISIIGLNLICNGLEATVGRLIPGVRGHLTFFYANNITIKDFTCLDLHIHCYAIQVSTFENFIAENIHVVGHKDAIHLGRGDKFVLRHCRLCTFDDPIALNAGDYAASNPQQGWIENGIIEDCYDLDASETTGYFCRLLGGSWVDWYEGMEVMHSDSVMVNGKMYRVFADHDGRYYKSVTKPTHEKGEQILDGIKWIVVQDDLPDGHTAGCRNIHFKDIHLQKKRNMAICLSFENSEWYRSYMPKSQAPMFENIIFENIIVENDVKCPIEIKTPVDHVKILNSSFGNSRIEVIDIGDERPAYTDTTDLHYGKADILMSGVTFKGEGEQPLINCSEGRECNVKIIGSAVQHDSYKPVVSKNINLLQCDLDVIRK